MGKIVFNIVKGKANSKSFQTKLIQLKGTEQKMLGLVPN